MGRSNVLECQPGEFRSFARQPPSAVDLSNVDLVQDVLSPHSTCQVHGLTQHGSTFRYRPRTTGNACHTSEPSVGGIHREIQPLTEIICTSLHICILPLVSSRELTATVL